MAVGAKTMIIIHEPNVGIGRGVTVPNPCAGIGREMITKMSAEKPTLWQTSNSGIHVKQSTVREDTGEDIVYLHGD